MPDEPDTSGRHLGALRRKNEERVTPLELFFDLVFVLALTQCTELMAHGHSWHGMSQGIIVLAALWWAWVGYAWLTSVIDAEEGAARLVIFIASAGMLVAALCVPEAFGDQGLTFAIAYGVVRLAHIWLFVLASDDEAALRRSVTGLAISTAIGVALLVIASFLDGWEQSAMWIAAILLDCGGPFLFGASGWKLVPNHFAERHGLIVIIALGESLIAIGIGAEFGLSGLVIVAAVLGTFLAAALWWIYFDVLGLAASRALEAAPVGRVQNEMARDAYSYLHFLLVTGIAGAAVGMKAVLGHVDAPLDTVSAAALVGGTVLYLLGTVAFKLRTLRQLSIPRLAAALVVLALLVPAGDVDALVTLAGVAGFLWVLIGFESVRYSETRDVVRHGEAVHDGDAPDAADD
jgi:low temperature requirement protein LtrA